ncbi:MAG: sulfotransferase domain-containing protein [Sphingobium sp.]|nr:sulfotransferase domain-containing protein [Sphingobium sp.]
MEYRVIGAGGGHPAGTRRVLQNHHMDSTRWDDFLLRTDDIVISTYGKSGTSWLQQIVAQLLFQGAPILGFPDMSPWLESRLIEKDVLFAQLEAQRHRRFIKSHLPFDALPWSRIARYIYSARDVRDLVWSLHRFHSNFRPLYLELLNNSRAEMGREFQPADPDIARYYRNWLEQDGEPFWPFWSHVKSWWEARHLPNVLLVHFNNLKTDLRGEVRRIAAFLDIAVDANAWPNILEHCSFAWMREATGKASHLMVHDIIEDGLRAFVHKGTNGRWKDILSTSEIALADRLAAEHLPPDCAHWLTTGELPPAAEY